MAEKINLATFEFDTDRLQSSLDALQTKMFALKKEQDAYNTSTRNIQKSINELTKTQLDLKEAGKELTDEYKDNEKAIEAYTSAQLKNYKSAQSVANSMRTVKDEVAQTQKQLRSYMDATGDFTTLQNAANVALRTEIKNKNDANAANLQLQKISNQLNPKIAQEAELLKKVNAQIDENTKFVKTNSSETAKQKMNIGNYTESIKDAIKESGILGGATAALGPVYKAAQIGFKALQSQVSEAKDIYDTYRQSQEAAKASQEVYNTLQVVSTETTAAAAAATETATAIGFKYAQGIATQAEAEAAAAEATIANTAAAEAQAAAQSAATVAADASAVSLGILKVALISTGIGAIVVLLGSLVAYFTQSQDGADKLSAVLEPLKAIFSGIVGVLTDLGRKLIDTFSNPKKALSDLVNFVEQNLINRFKAFGVILDGIIHLDFKKITNGVLQAGTGVTDLTDKIAANAKAVGKFFDDNAKKGAEIAKLGREIAAEQLKYNAAQVAIHDEIDEQLLIVKNTGKAFSERAAAEEKIIAITEKNGQAEKAILELKKKQLLLQQAIRGEANLTNEDRQKVIDIDEKIDEANDRGLQARIEGSRVLGGLEKEQATQALKNLEDYAKGLTAQLNLYLAQQGIRKKDMADQLAVDEEVMRRQLAINEAELKAKKVSQKEYEANALKIHTDFLAKQVEATVENANIELELFMLNNQKRLDAGAIFNDELYRQELERINKISEAQAANETLRFQQGQITEKEYNLAIAKIDADQAQQNYDLEQKFETDKKAKQVEDLANKAEAEGEAFQYDLALQTDQENQKYAAQLEASKKSGADIDLINQAHAERQKKIDQTVQDNKLQLASTTFGNIAEVLGKESAAGKAAGVAQTTIETYRGATAAFTGMTEAIPGPIGIALGVAAAAAAVVSGLANVKKILAVKPAKIDKSPSYATGVIGIDGPGSATSDSISARLSAGESVLTARATQMFPYTLSAMNRAGGGVGIDGQLASTIVQNQTRDRYENSLNMEAIAQAVALGARQGTSQGSKEGIVGLSTNRQIQDNAKF